MNFASQRIIGVKGKMGVPKSSTRQTLPEVNIPKQPPLMKHKPVPVNSRHPPTLQRVNILYLLLISSAFSSIVSLQSICHLPKCILPHEGKRLAPSTSRAQRNLRRCSIKNSVGEEKSVPARP